MQTKRHQLLLSKARAEGLVDITYDIIDTRIGKLLLAKTDKGLVRIAFEKENHDEVLMDLSKNIGPLIFRDSGDLKEISQQIHQYLLGERKSFTVELDLALVHGKYRKIVLLHLQQISYGQQESYATVAQLTDNPKAQRAVGSACATNPIPIIIPCHRVIRTDGKIGNYLAGADTKKILLHLESTHASIS